jgi:hypothetical protein
VSIVIGQPAEKGGTNYDTYDDTFEGRVRKEEVFDYSCSRREAVLI